MAFNVLIVDDSSSMRAVIKKVIKVSGFNVGDYWEAGDGNEADYAPARAYRPGNSQK